MIEIIYDYGQALKSKVGKSVDEKIWILELMEKYGQKFEYWENEIPAEHYDLAKGKLIKDKNKK